MWCGKEESGWSENKRVCGNIGPVFFVVAAAVAVVALAAEPVHWLLQRLCYSIGCGMDVCGQTELVSILRG